MAEAQALFVGIGVGSYHSTAFHNLPRVVVDTQAVAQVLTPKFIVDVIADPNEQSLRNSLRSLREFFSEGGGSLVLLWSGHGLHQEDMLRLATSDTKDLLGGISSDELIAVCAASGASQILIMLDVSYSGQGLLSATEAATDVFNARRPDAPAWIGIITTSSSSEAARGGLFTEVLLRLLTLGPQDPQTRARWSAFHKMIRGDDLCDALLKEWPGELQTLSYQSMGSPDYMFPNPLWLPGLPASEEGISSEPMVTEVQGPYSAADADSHIDDRNQEISGVGPQTLLSGGIAADLVDATKGIPREEDHLQLGTYVAMMATAIARTDTKLPLSIGLFGEWGSGKSYFMGLLREQVDVLATSGDPAYFPGIVQIGFNAWTYADTNLWASLGDEIFRELAGPSEDERETVEGDRRKYLRQWLANEQERIKELEATKIAAAAEVAKLHTELERNLLDRRASALTLLRATMDALQADPVQSARLRRAWSELGLADETEKAQTLADAITGMRQDVATLRNAAILNSRRYLLAGIAAFGVLFAIIGLASSGTVAQWLTRVVAATGLATALGAGVAIVATTRRAISGVRSIANFADDIRRRVHVGRDEEVQQALGQVRAAEAQQQVVQAQLDQLVARVGELGRELVELTPGQRLYAFLAERAQSDDYRRQLGLIATIRRDFEHLARLQIQWRNDKEGSSPRPIDRIVLYVDDLDRCTPRQVVEVLQAVHLLLALDLFVVVVGVDPRWLLRSLRDQYGSTLGGFTASDTIIANQAERPANDISTVDEDASWHEDADRLALSTPQDYLEKIFNLPFALPQMTVAGFDSMIRRLAEPQDRALRPQRGPSAGKLRQDANESPRERSPIEDGAGLTANRSDEATNPPAEEEGSEISDARRGERVVQTPMTEPELQMLSSLAPLVRSPRETKRLLNLYRVLRSTQDLSDASQFLGTNARNGQFQAVALLLGLLSGHPRLMREILFASSARHPDVPGGLCRRHAGITWQQFIQGLQPRQVADRWCNDVQVRLADHERREWDLLIERSHDASALVTLPDLTAFQRWAPHVARFSFVLLQEPGNLATRAAV